MEISRFHKTVGTLLLTTTLAVTSAEIISHLLPFPSDVEAVNTQTQVNIDGQLYTGNGISLKDPSTGYEILLNLGDRKTSNQYAGSISPDNSKIVFITQSFALKNHPSQFFISISGISGNNPTNLTEHKYSGNGSNPVWIDNETIAFVSHDINNTNTTDFAKLNQNGISIIKTDSSGKRQLDYTFENFKTIHTICFDGKTKRIFFVGSNYTKPDASNAYSELYSINPDGTNPQKVVSLDPNLTNWGVYNMKCLKDNRISLDLAPNGYPEPYTINSDGSNLQAVK